MDGFAASELTHRAGNGRAGSVQGGPSAATKGHAWFLGPRIGPSASIGSQKPMKNQQHAAKSPLLHWQVIPQGSIRNKAALWSGFFLPAIRVGTGHCKQAIDHGRQALRKIFHQQRSERLAKLCGKLGLSSVDNQAFFLRTNLPVGNSTIHPQVKKRYPEPPGLPGHRVMILCTHCNT